jgi:hypothetical protein
MYFCTGVYSVSEKKGRSAPLNSKAVETTVIVIIILLTISCTWKPINMTCSELMGCRGLLQCNQCLSFTPLLLVMSFLFINKQGHLTIQGLWPRVRHLAGMILT